MPHRLPISAALLAVSVVLSGCGGAPTRVTDRPTDNDSARALAKTVAAEAGCASVEDFSLAADDAWSFSCQYGSEATFVIRTASSVQLRDAARPTGSAYKVGEFFVVTPELTRPDLERLQTFPGELVQP